MTPVGLQNDHCQKKKKKKKKTEAVVIYLFFLFVILAEVLILQFLFMKGDTISDCSALVYQQETTDDIIGTRKLHYVTRKAACEMLTSCGLLSSDGLSQGLHNCFHRLHLYSHRL